MNDDPQRQVCDMSLPLDVTLNQAAVVGDVRNGIAILVVVRMLPRGEYRAVKQMNDSREGDTGGGAAVVINTWRIYERTVRVAQP